MRFHVYSHNDNDKGSTKTITVSQSFKFQFTAPPIKIVEAHFILHKKMQLKSSKIKKMCVLIAGMRINKGGKLIAKKK